MPEKFSSEGAKSQREGVNFAILRLSVRFINTDLKGLNLMTFRFEIGFTGKKEDKRNVFLAHRKLCLF